MTHSTTDEITAIEAAQPGTGLTIVSDTLTEFEKVTAGLGALQQRFAGVVYDVSTGKGMDQAKADRLEVREVRYAVQGTAKKAKDTLNEQKKLIEEKAAYIVSEITKIEDPIDATIKAEEKRKADEKAAREKAERERIAAIAVKLAAIRAQAVVLPGTKSWIIAAVIKDLLRDEPTEPAFGDLLPAAMRALDETILTLKKHHAAALEHEEQQAAARAEAQRLADERLAAEQKAAAEREAARIVANKLAEQQQAAFEAERAAFRQQQADAAAELARQRAELEALQPKPAPAVDIATFAPDNGVCGSRPPADVELGITEPSFSFVSLPPMAAEPAPAVEEEKATLKIGEVIERLGFVVTSKFLADLGHPPADVPGTRSKLYKPSEFGRICRSLIAHIGEVADKFEA